MGKTRKWLRNLLMSRKKHRDKEEVQCGANYDQVSSTGASEIPTPKEKRRWSFRRPSPSSDSNQLSNSAEKTNVTDDSAATDSDQNLQDNNITALPSTEDLAAIRIQSVFRSYLARKALSALRGIVKLQALVRGQLVRNQASATLRCIEALLTSQARACAHRIIMASQRHSAHPRKTQDISLIIRHMYDSDGTDMESKENIRIVNADVFGSKDNARSRNNTMNYTQPHASYSKEENHKVAPSPSSAQSSPATSDKRLPLTSCPVSVPNYMANTESSRAKFRSHSAPKQRPDTIERQLSRPKASMEARNSVHRAVMKMRRSSSSQHYQFPSSIKLDRSSVSLIESECGSSSTVLTNTQYCRSLVSYNPHEDGYY